MLTASYAKINLSLEVTGKLPNNYHQVNTVLCSIDLCDYIEYELSEKPGILFTCNDPTLQNNNNLVYRIADFLQTQFKVQKGVAIHLTKRIPVAAGLGGGSSNAANCLVNLNMLWELKFSESELHEIASDFGSDINFFLRGGTARGTNRGEQIISMPYLPIDNILLVNPGLKISSAKAYSLVMIPDQSELHSFDSAQWRVTSFNRLEPGIRSVYREVDDILQYLSKNGAKPALMSGSGSTCFGVFDDLDALSECKEYFSQEGYWTYVAKTIEETV
jgi:4-diphosphocytidyl-2-C-methyl-D-erythritol kinase